MFNCLLFLISVRSIQLSEIDEYIGKLVNSYAVVATLLPEDQKEHDNFVWCLRKPSADMPAQIVEDLRHAVT
jgi:hypothetical protein